MADPGSQIRVNRPTYAVGRKAGKLYRKESYWECPKTPTYKPFSDTKTLDQPM